MHVRLAIFLATDLGDRGGETAIRSIRRAALAIRAKHQSISALAIRILSALIARDALRISARAIRADKILIARAEMD